MSGDDLPEELQRALDVLKPNWSPEFHAALEESFRRMAPVFRQNARRAELTNVVAAALAVNHARTHFLMVRAALDNPASDLAFSTDTDFLYKHLFEDLRSALDYLACGLMIRAGLVTAGSPKLRAISFPCRAPAQSEVKFRRLADSLLPQLRERREDLFEGIVRFNLEDYDGRPWLWLVSEMTNVVKHRSLLRRLVGMVHTREGMRRIGDTWIAVEPSAWYDLVRDPLTPNRILDVAEFARASIGFVHSVVETLGGEREILP